MKLCLVVDPNNNNNMKKFLWTRYFLLQLLPMDNKPSKNLKPEISAIVLTDIAKGSNSN